jgi:hypothetical protein
LVLAGGRISTCSVQWTSRQIVPWWKEATLTAYFQSQTIQRRQYYCIFDPYDNLWILNIIIATHKYI